MFLKKYFPILILSLLVFSCDEEPEKSLSDLNILRDIKNINGGIECFDVWNGNGRLVELQIYDEENSIDTLPENIGDLSELDVLIIDHQSNLTSIPESIGQLTKLTYLSLGDNNLTGGIPSSIWNLTNLSYLRLKGNNLTGVISYKIGDLVNLRYLYLDSNQLSGSIPPSIYELNLEVLYLLDNNLTGVILHKICDYPLMELDPDCSFNMCPIQLSYNKFCYGYPDCLPESSIKYQDCTE